MGTSVRRLLAVAAGIAVLGGALAAVGPVRAAGAQEVYLPFPNGQGWAFVGYGSGTGVGLSALGAQQRATAGQSTAQILDFYYPGTASAAGTDQTIRVRLNRYQFGATVAGAPGLVVRDDATGTQTPLVDPAARYRALVDATAGHSVQKTADGGATWVPVPLADGSGSTGPLSFRDPAAGTLRVYESNGAAHGYAGALQVRTDRGGIDGNEYVNMVRVDDYTAAAASHEVAEVAGGWTPAALQAVAIAARTYAGFLRAHPATADYDTCDQTPAGAPCRGAHHAYDGYLDYSNGGQVPLVSPELQAAVTATAGATRTFDGQPADAEYGVSNTGWTVAANGLPYLRAARDTFDFSDVGGRWAMSAISDSPGNPVIMADRLTVLHRDGHGAFGGRITELRAERTRNGVTTTTTVSAEDLVQRYGLISADFVIVSAFPPAVTPAAVSFGQSPGVALEQVAPGPNGEVWVRRYNIETAPVPWFEWTMLGGGLKDAPAVLRMPDGSARVFLRGTNDALYTGVITGARLGVPVLHGWQKLGGAITSRPYPTLLSDGSVMVFFRRTDGALGFATYKAGAVRGWGNLGGSVSAGSGPAAAATAPGQVTAFIRGARGGIYARSLAGGRWSGWLGLGGDAIGDLAAAAPARGVVDLYLRGTTGAGTHPLYTRRATNGRWAGWVNAGQSPAAGPYAANVGPLTTVTFLGTDGHAHYAQRVNATWRPWTVTP